MLRVVHYLNQFFGGIGGEDKAHVKPQITEGAIGPGRAIQNELGDQGKVVATVACGDNFFIEHVEEAAQEVLNLIKPYQPDILIAGPAFNAGRYGIACGALCQATQNQLGIPAVTGMYHENPGLDLYRRDIYIVQTIESLRGMVEAIAKMVNIALLLAKGSNVGRPAEAGYFPRGHLVNEISEKPGAERVVDMLLRKLRGEPFESEVPRPVYDRVAPTPKIEDMSAATIALVTDGGLSPKGNPDKIESRAATRFGRYDIRGIDRLDSENYEVNHAGYDSIFVRQDPNRLVPVDMMRELEKEGTIGKLYDKFYSTAGVACIVDVIQKLGQTIARELKEGGVSGVLLTST